MEYASNHTILRSDPADVYRFVFLDACGAYSSQMARAFGVPFSRNGRASSVSTYLRWHRPPRAFVGWDVSVMGSDITDSSGLCDLHRVAAQQIVVGYWQAGGYVEEAMEAWDGYIRDKRCLANGTTYEQV